MASSDKKTNKALTPTQAASALWLVQNAVGYEDVLGDEQCGFGDAIRPAVDAALAAQEEALAAGKDDCDANDAMYPAFLKAVMELTDGTEEQVDAEFDRISEENSVA
jgi:hypothetical protein